MSQAQGWTPSPTRDCSQQGGLGHLGGVWCQSRCYGDSVLWLTLRMVNIPEIQFPGLCYLLSIWAQI